MKNLKFTHMLFIAALLCLIPAVASAFGYHLHPEAMVAGASLLAVGDTEAVGIEIKQLLQRQGEAFNEFKKTNDEILKNKAEGKAVADLEAKLSKIETDLTQFGNDIMDIAKKQNRPAAPGSDTLTAEQQEYKTAFRKNFMRKGDTSGLRELERKAFTIVSDVDGGYLIDEEMDREIDRVATVVSAMRTVADVRSIGKASIEMNVKTSGTAATWVNAPAGEAGGETPNPKYAQIEIYAEEMEIEPWARNSSLEDTDFDIEADVAMEAGIGFGQGEAAAFISGDGVKKPRGILTYPIVANASYAWGNLGYIASGGAGAFAASNPGDNVIDLLHSLRSQYRNGAKLMMADTTLAALRKLKDGSGNFYLFNPDATGQFPGFVLGVPVVIDDNMPAIAANSYSIAYGNFQRGYRIVDRKGIALIRDNLTLKGTTKFNFRKRVGGGVRHFEAIKLMKFAAS